MCLIYTCLTSTLEVIALIVVTFIVLAVLLMKTKTLFLPTKTKTIISMKLLIFQKIELILINKRFFYFRL